MAEAVHPPGSGVNLGAFDADELWMRSTRVQTCKVTVAMAALMVLVGGCVPNQQAKAAAGPGGGSFKVTCSFSHRRTDDPIVHPDMPAMSHSHDFFGNRSTDATSTAASLLNGTTTCSRGQDRSAYWIPTVSYDGVPTTPIKAVIYYVGRAGRVEQPIPTGLKIVAGSAMAAGPQSTTVVSWRCAAVGGVAQPSLPEPPQCPAGSTLNARVNFPNCWDGTHLDTADHASHLAYDVHRKCDGAHPVNLPKIAAEYFLPNPDGAAVSLASGAPLSLHGDFFSAWDQAEMSRLVTTCINAGLTCGGR